MGNGGERVCKLGPAANEESKVVEKAFATRRALNVEKGEAAEKKL